MIESYSFGRIVIDGRVYNSDIIIYPDGRVQDSWWRKEGHTLSISDIGDLVNTKPDIIIAGTGANGLMRPEGKLESHLTRMGIAFQALPTAEAVKLFNEHCKTRKAGACFHLTC